MNFVYWLGASIHQKQLHRWLLAIAVGAAAGIVAGRTVIASISGSVSIVDGLSMSPTYAPGARVYTAPITTPLQRGDIVLIDDGNKGEALKRVIGMPGETVHLWRGAVFVNRQMLREPYLPRLTFTFPDERAHTFVFRLGADQYFVLGDNRLRSLDSRSYGPVGRKHIYSRVPCQEMDLRPDFASFILPPPGKRTVQAL